jgi:hypothetical protein
MKWLRRAGLLALVLLVPLAIVRHGQIWWWIEVHDGTVNEPGPYYGFWSGFGSDIPEYSILVGVVQGLSMHWRHVNCHSPGCPWVGRYPAAGGQFRYCHKHHPDFGGKPPTWEHMLEQHCLHKSRMAAADQSREV